MKTLFKVVITLVIMIGFDFLYLFVYMQKDGFELESFIVFFGIELFILLFIKELKKFLSK